jgi:2-methylcitrate dehydratase PrpD
VTVTDELAQFIRQTTYSDLPSDVIHQAKRCFLDWMGVTLGGCRSPLASILLELVQCSGGNQQSTIIGAGCKTTSLQACLVNGSASHALDYDDVHMGVLLHPSAPVIPVIMALGEAGHRNGRDVIEAFVVAYEIEAKLGLALGTKHYDRGWHATATLGRLGAATAAAKLLGLDHQQICYALGLAATQASGLRQVFGSMAKPLHAGKAAEDGLFSALLAQRNFTCSEDTLEGRFGFFHVLGQEDVRPELAVEKLGKPFEVMSNTFKPHASCTLTHPAIDSALDIRRESHLDEEIASVLCRVPKYTLDAAGQVAPTTGLAAKFSVYYCVALALLEGRTGEDQFTDSQVRRPELARVRALVTAEVVPSFSNTEAEVVVRTKDGREFKAHTTKPKGDPSNPISDEELGAKFRSLTSFLLSWQKIEKLHAMLMSLENVQDLAGVIELAA